MVKNYTALMYTCSLIEYIGRKQKLPRNEVIEILGKEVVARIYEYSDVLHCEPIERVADEYIEMESIPIGNYDNVKKCKYEVPDYWDIGEVYARLIEDVDTGNVINTIFDVYNSWISDSISNYNSDFFYQSRDYIKECYIRGTVLE